MPQTDSIIAATLLPKQTKQNQYFNPPKPLAAKCVDGSSSEEGGLLFPTHYRRPRFVRWADFFRIDPCEKAPRTIKPNIREPRRIINNACQHIKTAMTINQRKNI